MVALEISPDTTVVSTHYLHTVEDQSVADHERLIEKEAELLCVQAQANEWQKRLADTQLTAELQRAAHRNANADLEVTWRNRFYVLFAFVAVACWLLATMLVVPHWDEISGWFR